MGKVKTSRRSILSTIAVFISGTIFNSSTAAAQRTPKATEGPFYPTKKMRMPDTDNDLVKVDGLVQESGGEIIRLQGVVQNEAGDPLQGLRVEIWQCDVNGKYLHSGDDRDVAYDKGFQGFGHDITTVEGVYSFRTIKPTRYPGRTPHIHVKVCEGEKELLTTQFYLKDHPDNNGDSLFRRLSSDQADSVSMLLVETGSESVAEVNIVV